MHDRDELHLELSLHIMGNMFDGGGDGVMGSEWQVYNNAKAFYLEVSFIQGLEGASIVKVVVKGHSEVGVCDGGD